MSDQNHSSGRGPVLPRPTTERWQILRAGIQNIWEYDDQRFIFRNGRLVLRGRNESGKTKAIEVLLPFLLDADLAPERLDPFGSTARLMRWNLIRDSNVDAGTIVIGYVWLEFARHGAEDEFFTIGAGLKARRTETRVEPWFFTTTQRIDQDLHPLEFRPSEGRRVPLVRKRLEEAIGAAGRVHEDRDKYRKAVNEHLFRLADAQYEALVEMLLQLRRPQLSAKLDPEGLSEILSASLPPLDAGVISPLAEGFERLDRHQAERDAHDGALKEIRKFLDVYRRYVQAAAKARALELTRAESAYQKARGGLRDAEEDHAKAERECERLESEIARLQEQEVVLDQRLSTWRNSDEYKSVEEVERAERTASDKAEKAREAQRSAEEEKKKADDRARKLVKAEEEAREAMAELDRLRTDATARADAAALAVEHQPIDAIAIERGAKEARGLLAVVVGRRREVLSSLQKLAKRVAQAAEKKRSAEERLREAQETERRARESLHAAETAERSARDRYVESVSTWTETVVELALDTDARAALLAAPLDEMRARIDAHAATRRNVLAKRRGQLAAAVEGLDADIELHRERRERIAQETHAPPPAPAWRPVRPTDRPGAPLYCLCDFRDGEPAAQARLEAALQASGILDAWLAPDGVLLDRRTFDVLLAPRPRPRGRTLHDALVPTEAADVSSEAIACALRTIELVEAGSEAESDCWISTDGSWRLGPLHGAWSKEAAAYIGATAQEQERKRRLTELDNLLARLADERGRLVSALASVDAQAVSLDEELLRLPDMRDVLEARAEVRVAQTNHTTAQNERASREKVMQAAVKLVADETAARDAEARRHALSAWVEALDKLGALTTDYQNAAGQMIVAAQEVRSKQERAEEVREDAGDARERAARASREWAAIREGAMRAAEHARSLLERVGTATREELLRKLQAAEDELQAAKRELKAQGLALAAERERRGSTRSAWEQATARVTTSEADRKTAETRFKEFARRGLLLIAGLQKNHESPDRWTFTDTVQAARDADAGTPKIDASPSASDALENRVNDRHQDLLRSVSGDVRILPQRVDNLLEYNAVWNGRPMNVLALVEELESDVADRDRRLAIDERELFESFLTGQTHDHVQARLRGARSLVNRMNGELEKRPTPSGAQLQLRWEVTREAPAGTSEAVDLLLRAGNLLTDADKAALMEFLQQRLKAARTQDGTGTLLERMLAVLDYRAWFAFSVEQREPGRPWKALTRKEHSAGSGGRKAVMLHLPLFAAAAAFYESAQSDDPARRTSARVIVLDEAFAGIDRPMRAELMGLLVEFDLDFVMTSYDEWGFYAQLDGLSTYHLSREQGFPGVHADWFLWDGKQPVQMGSA